MKVSLAWNSDDTGRALLDSLFADDSKRARYFTLPSTAYSSFQYDSVRVSDAVAGISTRGGYNTNLRAFVSLAMVDEHIAHEGAEVVVIWGEANGGTAKPYLQRHVPTEVFSATFS